MPFVCRGVYDEENLPTTNHRYQRRRRHDCPAATSNVAAADSRQEMKRQAIKCQNIDRDLRMRSIAMAARLIVAWTPELAFHGGWDYRSDL